MTIINGAPSSWGDWAAAVAVAAAICGALYLLLRARLGADFMPRDEVNLRHTQNIAAIESVRTDIEGLHNDHSIMDRRVSNVEQKLSALPTRGDLQRVEDKVGTLVGEVGKMAGSVEGLSAALDRNFTQLQMLTRSQLPERRE
jgi:hypothetical protein